MTHDKYLNAAAYIRGVLFAQHCHSVQSKSIVMINQTQTQLCTLDLIQQSNWTVILCFAASMLDLMS